VADPKFLRLAYSDPKFADCFAIRREVFVAEQNVPLEEEQDEHDATALHLLALLDGKPAATARVLLKEGNTAKITRVAVVKQARGTGLGAALMREAEAASGAEHFILDAQSHALSFYTRLGYRAVGDEFLEAGIPHRHMVKSAGDQRRIS
jgi:predicted GNAT family N-acyltransferase